MVDPDAVLDGWLAQYPNLNTRQGYRIEFGVFRRWCAERGVSLFEVTPEVVGQYVEHRLATRQKNTASRSESTVRSFYRYAAGVGAVAESPVVTRLAPVRHDPLPDTLSLAELRGMIEAAASKDAALAHRPVIGLLALQGLRVNEICRANFADLRRRGGFDLLHLPARGPDQFVVLAGVTSSALRDHGRGRRSKALVVNRAGSRTDREAIARIVQELANDTGIGHRVTARSVRLSMGAAALELGVPAAAVLHAAGTNDARFFDRIARFDPNDLPRHASVHLERQLLQRSLAEDPLHQIFRLVDDENVMPVAPIVMTAALLERELRVMAKRRRLTPRGDSMLDLAGPLKSCGVISSKAHRELEKWNDLRNEAAHGRRFDDLTVMEAREFAEWARDFLRSLGKTGTGRRRRRR